MAYLRALIAGFVCLLAFATASELHPLSDAFIDLINSKQTTWKAGRNFPNNTSIKHIRRLAGAHPEYKTHSLPIVKHNVDDISELPVNFDPREKWPNCPSLNEIRDQASCGSCWAISAVETMTDRFCIYANGTRQFHFSVEDLISCCSSCGSCQGGNPIKAWSFWEKSGLVSGGNYHSNQGCKPYSFPSCTTHDPAANSTNTGKKPLCSDYDTVKTPKCLKKCSKNYGLPYKKDKQYGGQIYMLDSGEDNIKAELFVNGPIVAVFEVYTDFFNYKSGVYKHVAGEFIYGHAVKMIGWGEENGTKYWLIANSWNADWGDHGFFKILRGENHLGIESFALTGEPLLPEA